MFPSIPPGLGCEHTPRGLCTIAMESSSYTIAMLNGAVPAGWYGDVVRACSEIRSIPGRTIVSSVHRFPSTTTMPLRMFFLALVEEGKRSGSSFCSHTSSRTASFVAPGSTLPSAAGIRYGYSCMIVYPGRSPSMNSTSPSGGGSFMIFAAHALILSADPRIRMHSPPAPGPRSACLPLGQGLGSWDDGDARINVSDRVARRVVARMHSRPAANRITPSSNPRQTRLQRCVSLGERSWVPQ
mmetsp:Transcript_40231/g.95353  ORF Transcript_40231/g.95353 Transcript_40231/m.95353 type:complete len:241 (-) Transcript_40231:102-824(-)